MLIPAISLLLLGSYLLCAAYRLDSWHPLSHVRGPWWTAFSSAWLQYHNIRGTQGRATRALHEKYGPVVRVAPNEVEFADGAAIWPIYIKNGGFHKSHHYSTLDIEGHSTVFSTLQNRKRADQLKAALPFFSSASVQRQVPMPKDYAGRLMLRIDTTSRYVFGEAFGALDQDRLSISPMVDSFVEVNLVFNIPSYARQVFNFFCWNYLVVKAEVKQPNAMIDKWIRGAIAQNLAAGQVEGQKASPGKLAAMGMPLNNVMSEGKDSIFGATDALGLALSLSL